MARRKARRRLELSVTEKQYKNVLVEREGGITFVALNRPDQRNAMSPELHYEMEEVIDWMAADGETKVLVLTGVGESWCAGQDIRLYFRATQDNPQERTRSNAASHRWRWDAQDVPQTDHRDGQWLLLRGRVHAAVRRRFRHHGGRRALLPFRAQLGTHSG